MKITILGCGPSNGVPTVTGEWRACNPQNPKNIRSRPSILIQLEDINILVDTSPDFRSQAINAGITGLDAILFTHEHADHIMGIDDIRGIARKMGKQIDVFASSTVLTQLINKFGYLFVTDNNVNGLYRPIYRPRAIIDQFKIKDRTVTPFKQDHGICESLGYRIENFAYSTDVVRLTDQSLKLLRGLDCWVVDCLRKDPAHPTHAHWDVVREWIEKIKPKRVILTHMNFETDYDEFLNFLPDGVEPAYDGLVINL